ncbi:RNA-binding cell elongation regulator Jag/EloR [Sporolactobacillus kofuensis]|uniref:RNA-binding protein KhpB n=1 Tax=Sporolactobacillus kofuensis TaxID=269672 RepID=A0ABW1WCL0_9BACL|nr:protein jag [Sporolactobacillus kofuensis]
MREVTKYGKTVADAVSIALKELNATVEQVTVQVVEAPRSGFFGIGAKKALVKVMLNKTFFDSGVDYLTEIIKQSGLSVHIQVEERNARVCRCRLVGHDAALLIGKHGKTLNALQFLAERMVNSLSEHHLSFFLDAENYRAARKKALVELAQRIADKTVRSGRPYRFEPMPAFERKIVHHALSRNQKIQTYSKGDEPRRYLIVAPRS